jgi:hypothetical protein
MKASHQELKVVRDLAKRYLDIAMLPVQNERRRLWADHFSLKSERIPIKVGVGPHNKWCMAYFTDRLECESPVLRQHEQAMRMAIFLHDVGDDTIVEPWLTQRINCGDGWAGMWGVRSEVRAPDSRDGAWRTEKYGLAELEDIEKLQVPHHAVDAEDSSQFLHVIQDAVGDILPVNVHYGPRALGFSNDLVTILCMIRGMEQVMLDMCMNPEWLHRVMAFMRDGVLTNHREAETAGAFTLASHTNQAMPYAHELEWPRANSGPRLRKQLWGFCAAQEMALVSPEMHEEFIFNYQLPIMQEFGLVHYGCCEDLSRKIDMLRRLPNLRSIAVTPSADVSACVEQIGTDYAVSWRPNPTDMVCSPSFNPDHVRSVLRTNLDILKGTCTHIQLKDIETLGGDVTRLKQWVDLTRQVIG